MFLGIDTGGTYTDAVLYDSKLGVVCSGKALTTPSSLGIGISQVLDKVLVGDGAKKVQLVSLSTTLATNAIVEGQGSPICLLLLGYERQALQQAGLKEVMKNDPVVFIAGGHLVSGQERESLDIEAAERAVRKYADRTSAFAVSGYFSVRNPEHEHRTRQIIRRLTDLPVTCGHELSSNLHAARRALTAALNARLIPLLKQLILAVQTMLERHQIRVPLMVVKGDGSLVSAEFALDYPIETILSGPAASVVGAVHLCRTKTACVVDMGGTTTDIALLESGRPVLSREGATVGGWQTMVEAVQIYTYGLGGDSEVHLEQGGGFTLGPRRTIPLSLLAHDHPQVAAVLDGQIRHPNHELLGRFAVYLRSDRRLSRQQKRILETLDQGPVAFSELTREVESEFMLIRDLEQLRARGCIGFSSFTPTDAAHVLGEYQAWSTESARQGAKILLRLMEAAGSCRVSTVADLCRAVLRQIVLQAGRALATAIMAETHGIDLDEWETMREFFIDRALRRSTEADEEKDAGIGLDVDLILKKTIIAIGAPAQSYFPAVARSLHTELIIPPHAEVANAIGAVAGNVVQTVHLLISVQGEAGCYRLHLPDGIQDFSDLDTATDTAIKKAEALARELALRAGAEAPEVRVERKDRVFRNDDEDEEFLESEISGIAIGRPCLGRQHSDF